MKWDNACKSLCRREPWRQDLAGSALRTGRHEDPSGVGHQRDADPPHSAPLRGRYQTKVRPSYVEETLFAAPQAPGPHHQTLTPPGGRRPTEPEGWGRGCHRHRGPTGAVSPPPPAAAPQPSHQGRTNTDWPARPLLTAVSLWLLTWERRLGGQVDAEGRCCKAPCPLPDNPSYP